MNDFVLRGFCQNCGLVCDYNIRAKYWESCGTIIPGIHGGCHGMKHDVIGFLSARQMQIVFGSDEFEKWAGQENYFELYDNAFTLIVKVLEKNPFLVAKILKEAGEKEGENK